MNFKYKRDVIQLVQLEKGLFKWQCLFEWPHTFLNSHVRNINDVKTSHILKMYVFITLCFVWFLTLTIHPKQIMPWVSWEASFAFVKRGQNGKRGIGISVDPVWRDEGVISSNLDPPWHETMVWTIVCRNWNQ